MPGRSTVTNTWIMFTVKEALLVPMLLICSFSTTLPTPGRSMVVFGAGVTVMGTPLTTKVTKLEPAALTWKPVASRLVVLTALTSLAVMSPDSRLASWTSADVLDVTALPLAIESAVVSITPVVTTWGTFTVATVLVLCTPAVVVQPSVTKALLPATTVVPTKA